MSCSRLQLSVSVSPGQENATYSLHNVHMTKQWVLRLATHPKLLAPLQAVLGHDLLLLDSRFITKYPTPTEKDAFVAWHQDVRYLLVWVCQVLVG